MPFRLSLILVAAICAAMAWAMLWLNDGTFLYTQDDPYIHLALAENLARGHYGINTLEFSSPSSSILYPLLLVPGVPAGVEHALPLAINLAALLAAVWLLQRLARRAVGPVTAGAERRLAIALVVLVLSLNLVGLAFTGLGHSLQVLVSLVVLFGLVVTFEDGRFPWWLAVAIVVGPLIRYEGLAISLAAAIVLTLGGWWRPAAASVLLLSLLLAAHGGYLAHLGLPILPSSVMVKSPVAWSLGDVEAPPLWRTLLANLQSGLASERGLVLAVLSWLVALGAVRARPFRWRNVESALAGFIMLAVAAHFLAGRFGWFSRYEIYIMSAVAAALLYVWRRPFGRLVAARSPWPTLALVAAIAAAGWPYLRTTALTPIASNEVYHQQWQMHRFATEFLRGPAAVNDLGLLSYRNPHYVLDIWGLGLEEIRRANASGIARTEIIDRLVRERGVQVAMIYAHWFPDVLPASWLAVAKLNLGHRAYAVDTATVTFFATSPEAVGEVRALLERFAATLPPGPRLELLPQGGLRRNKSQRSPRYTAWSRASDSSSGVTGRSLCASTQSNSASAQICE